jgi:DNA-binding MarR family transcriptional regulator
VGEIPFFDTRAAFAMRVGQFTAVLYEQMERCLQSHGLKLPGHTTSIVQALYHGGDHSISDLALRLRLSHQLASQRVKWLVREGFATMTASADDRRVRIVSLTAAGREEAARLQAFLPRLQASYSHLFEEVGIDLHRTVLDATAALQERSLADRLASLSPAAGGSRGSDIDDLKGSEQ